MFNFQHFSNNRILIFNFLSSQRKNVHDFHRKKAKRTKKNNTKSFRNKASPSKKISPKKSTKKNKTNEKTQKKNIVQNPKTKRG